MKSPPLASVPDEILAGGIHRVSHKNTKGRHRAGPILFV